MEEQMNFHLTGLDLDSFSHLMGAYKKDGRHFRYCIDGGAGYGLTATEMLSYINDDGIIFAFEPFTGNHRFFEKITDDRIRLIKKALFNERSVQQLFVRSTVAEESLWGRGKMLTGYSSLGFVDGNPEKRDPEKLYSIECVAADEEISPDTVIDFVKLDLQGGELNALRGMKRIIHEPYFLWIEFSDQNELLEYLYAMGFAIFETQYLFVGSNPDIVKRDFVFSKTIALSTEIPAWLGRRITPWGKDFHDEFQVARRQFGLVQTDIVCVQESRHNEFISALRHLAI